MIKNLVKALKTDKGYFYSWQANIAMAFEDTYYQKKLKNKPSRKDIHEISNEAAIYFLGLLCKPVNKVKGVKCE